jgi:hypothetical protein
VEICFPVHNLVIQLTDAQALKLPAERFDENQIRPASTLVRRLLALDPAPLTTARERASAWWAPAGTSRC